ncbi:RNA polymerase sigma factor [Thalassolituus maritimus]|uniref:RNA polymerase sigma factor n=1 Tax=Thalassolituus maritimus TaxID=484498 RepID=UPI001C37BA55|nr:sigma-70 family RNA polymerase sigma factor [Thalassolituus maritimus]
MDNTAQRLNAVWHLESAAITGSLARLLSDLTQAEDIAQDTLLTALENWRAHGVPENPGGWLMVTARNKALDLLRQKKRRGEHLSSGDFADESLYRERLASEYAGGDLEAITAEFDVSRVREDEVGDDILRLMFICCHPLLPPDSRVALVLKLVAGLSVDDIARAYLVPVTTLAQRITRAKKTLSAARIPFELPPEKERQARLKSVLESIYLLFNEGYVATQGAQWTQPLLCHQALRLTRSLAALINDDTDVLGLAALLEYQASRLNARQDKDGNPVLLAQQNRALWDAILIRRGHDYLSRAFGLGSAIGSYCLQAGIAACHARAASFAETRWDEIVALYDGLLQIQPTAVVRLNRAVALACAGESDVALAELDAIARKKSLTEYAPYYAARGDVLERLGRFRDAGRAFHQAAELSQNRAENRVLSERAKACRL